ncbi:MAG: FAD-dependent oxidoreductase [Rhodospirillaceae bacterium]
MTGRVHIVGGGLAGLSCAIAAAKKNIPVTIYEATRRAGGRCRSFHDQDLDRVLDNGSHVVLAGNPSVFEYLSLVGASNELVPSGTNKEVSFVDLKSNQKWNLKPSQGRLPFFLLSSQRRPPQTHLWQYATALGLIAKADKATVSDILGKTGIAWNSFWEPLSVAIMNTNPDEASAFLLGSALKRTLLSRNGGIQSFVPRESLSKTFVEPALNKIKELGGSIRFDCPLTHLEVKSKAKALIFRDQTIELAPMDIVVLAIPHGLPRSNHIFPETFLQHRHQLLIVIFSFARKLYILLRA